MAIPGMTFGIRDAAAAAGIPMQDYLQTSAGQQAVQNYQQTGSASLPPSAYVPDSGTAAMGGSALVNGVQMVPGAPGFDPTNPQYLNYLKTEIAPYDPQVVQYLQNTVDPLTGQSMYDATAQAAVERVANENALREAARQAVVSGQISQAEANNIVTGASPVPPSIQSNASSIAANNIKAMTTAQASSGGMMTPPKVSGGTSTGPVDAINNTTVNKLADQLKAQYDALNQNAGYTYGGKQSDLDKMFRAQAAKLAVNGINDLADVGESDGTLINKVTGDPIKKVNLKGETWQNDGSKAFEFKEDIQLEDRGSFQRWGKDVSVDGQADYGINFVDGQAVMVPIWKDTATDTGPLAAIAAVGLTLAFPQLAGQVGSFLASGASPAVQAAVGSAALAGVSTGVITGDMDKALIAAALAGGGSYLNASGTLGEAFDSLGLGDFKDTFGIQGGVPTGAGGGAAGALADAEFIAADAAQLAQQGLSTAQIQQTLLASGVDPVIAASAANLASSGAGYSDILQDIQGFGADAGGLFTATPSDMTAFGGITSTNTGGLGLTPEQLGAIQRGEIPGGTFAEMADAAKFIIPGGAAAGGLLDKAASDAAKSTLAEQAKGLLSGSTITDLLGAGIDYAALQQIGKEATALGREAEAMARASASLPSAVASLPSC